ncbi:class I SAM-dependent methyltransferase [Amphibacillus cookii]|uniref:class I SAM-dependent methyltransferase n=1 Tax=Amphibacillus cookii TaxID=767787 RepID=UPI0019583E41|nr:class I SAM-dependent methyltransferase [Amphibacillus cookii]MBM7542250.1 ubiquinone/menaquinone biosynthesis C-methylase UbiE [Amphibacillus cookii]
MKEIKYGSDKKFAKKVEFLDNPEKRGDIPPEKLLNLLPINKQDKVLDLGAGTGYMTIPTAKWVEGPVYALDIDPKMLAIINAKARDENITNIQTLEDSIDAFLLRHHSIDLVLASLVLHEIEPLSLALERIKQVLKTNGHFVCLEFEKEENPNHSHPRIAAAVMEQEIKDAGLSITKKLQPKDGIYIIIARKNK